MSFKIALTISMVFIGLCGYPNGVSEVFDTRHDCQPSDSRFSLPPIERAVQLLDSINVCAPEGIWEYPGENVKVLILRGQGIDNNRYDIKVLEAFTCDLNEGDLLGWLSPCAEKNKFELHQYTRRKKSILDLPGKCFVTLTDDGSVLLISDSRKISFSFRPLTLLPKFWKTVRISTKGKTREPAEGLRKIYPAESDNSGSKNKRVL